MIQILIAEDNRHKLENIKKIIFDLNIAPPYVDEATCVKDAMTWMYGKFYDLVILDLVLPNETGEDANAKHGSMLLNDIYSNPSIKTPMYIIGLTQFDNLINEYSDEFKKKLWHLINYQPDNTEWQDQIKTIAFHLIKARERFLKNTIRKDEYEVGIITALTSPEFEAIFRLTSVPWEKVQIDDDVTNYYKNTFEEGGKKIRIIAAAADQMGMTATSHLATKMIFYFKPKYLIMAGILAGIKDRGLGFGDIIVAEQCWDYGSGKMVDDKPDSGGIENIKFEPDLRPIQLSSELKSKISSFHLNHSDLINKIKSDWPGEVPTSQLKMFLGPVASGSYVISSEKTLDTIKASHRKLLGVEMESYGLYYAADHSSEPKTKAISIKSVTDYGDGEKNDKFQRYAAYTSARFIYYFIMKELL